MQQGPFPDASVPSAEPAADPPLDVGRIGAAIRRYARPVAIVVIAAMAIALLVSMLSPARYQATARIASDTTTVAGAPVDANAAAGSLASARELVSAPGVLTAVAATLPNATAGSLAPRVTAAVETDAAILDVTATAADGAGAARLANAVATTFLARRAAAQRQVATRARDALATQVEAAGAGTPATPLTAMRERIGDLAVAQATAGADLRLAERATAPAHRSAPHPLRSALLAGLAALLLAVAAAVVRDRRRPRVDDRADELAAEARLPLLSVLPRGRRRPDVPWQKLPREIRSRPPFTTLARRRARRAADDERRALAEAATLQAAVRDVLPPRVPRVLLVCGARSSDRAQLVAAALARSFEWAGQDALLIAPEIHDVVPAIEAARQAGWRYVIVGLRAAESLRLPALAPQASGAIIVGRAGRTEAADAAAAARLLRVFGVHVLGLVVTASRRTAVQRRARGFDAAAARRRGVRRDLQPNGAGHDGGDKPLANGRGNPSRMHPA
jgi:capsular polysaccharide biosynthesis protein